MHVMDRNAFYQKIGVLRLLHDVFVLFFVCQLVDVMQNIHFDILFSRLRATTHYVEISNRARVYNYERIVETRFKILWKDVTESKQNSFDSPII